MTYYNCVFGVLLNSVIWKIVQGNVDSKETFQLNNTKNKEKLYMIFWVKKTRKSK